MYIGIQTLQVCTGEYYSQLKLKPLKKNRILFELVANAASLIL